MKVKFVKVWDDQRWGYVNHIILQVEESDIFLIKSNFNPGYKFIIKATHNNVGAAGGNDLNPYHGNRVSDISQKIQSTESDVLGFYLHNIKDIYDIPEELYTDSFWNVVTTDRYCENNEDLYNDCDSYYKVLHTGIYTIDELWGNLLDIKNKRDGFFEEMGIDIDGIFKNSKEFLDNINETSRKLGIAPSESRNDIRFAVIDKNSLKIVNDKHSSAQRVIAEYLWCPCDEIPDSLWEKVQEKNELKLDRIYKTTEDIKVN